MVTLTASRVFRRLVLACAIGAAFPALVECDELLTDKPTAAAEQMTRAGKGAIPTVAVPNKPRSIEQHKAQCNPLVTSPIGSAQARAQELARMRCLLSHPAVADQLIREQELRAQRTRDAWKKINEDLAEARRLPAGPQDADQQQMFWDQQQQQREQLLQQELRQQRERDLNLGIGYDPSRP